MATFQAYEQQLLKLVEELQISTRSAQAQSAADLPNTLKEIAKGTEDADSLVRQMDLEARTTPASERAALLSRLRELKLQVMSVKRSLKELSASSASATSAESVAPTPAASDPLSGGSQSDYVALNDADQRTRLLGSTARLAASSASLAAGRQTLQQTEHLGVGILQDLHRQRQALMRSGDTLHDVDDMLARSRQVLGAMARKMNRSRWLTGGVLALLVTAVCLVIFLKLHRWR